MSSDLHPTRHEPATTRKPMTLTPETKIVVQLGGVLTAIGFIVWLSITAYKIQANGDEALRRLDKLEPIIEEHKRMWWYLQPRLSSSAAPGPVVGP